MDFAPVWWPRITSQNSLFVVASAASKELGQSHFSFEAKHCLRVHFWTVYKTRCLKTMLSFSLLIHISDMIFKIQRVWEIKPWQNLQNWDFHIFIIFASEKSNVFFKKNLVLEFLEHPVNHVRVFPEFSVENGQMTNWTTQKCPECAKGHFSLG